MSPEDKNIPNEEDIQDHTREGTTHRTEYAEEVPLFNNPRSDRSFDRLPDEILPPSPRPRLAQVESTDTPTTTTAAVDGATPGTEEPAHQYRREDLPTTIAGPLRLIRYSNVKNRITLLQELVDTIPVNEYGLPIFLYKPDLLNPSDFDTVPSPERARELQYVLASSIINVNYNEGFPTFESTMPIWSQLEWETFDAFQAFTQYLEEEGARSLHKLISYPQADLTEWFTLNYWSVRSKAFDLYKAAHYQRERARRIMRAERSHYDIAEKMLVKVEKQIDKMSQEDWDNLEPLQAATIIEKLTKVQRVSVGLPAMGGDDKHSEGRRITTVEVAMRRIADVTHAPQKEGSGGVIDLLREAPDAVDLAQEMILRIQSPKEANDR